MNIIIRAIFVRFRDRLLYRGASLGNGPRGEGNKNNHSNHIQKTLTKCH